MWRRYFEDLQKKCTENFWYKVELRVARAIVNLAGRFEADISSSLPEYSPVMNNHGLPVFHYDKRKKELGMIVKGWNEGFFLA